MGYFPATHSGHARSHRSRRLQSATMETSESATFGHRIIHPQTIWDRVVRWGLFCVALSAILSVAFSAFYFLLWPLRVLFAPVALALVVVYLLNPLVNLLERRGLRRGFGVAIIYVLFVVVVAVGMSLLVPIIARQITGFIEQLPAYVQDATREINQFAAKRGWDYRINLDTEQIQQYVVDNREAIIGVLGGVRSFAFGVIHILITLVIGIILSIYILLDMPKIQRSLRNLMPEGRGEEIATLADKVGNVLGGFFRGQFLVALFVGIASAVGLTIVGIPFAAVVGLIAGVFNLVPLIGPFIGAIPAVILALLSDQPVDALWAGLVLLGVQQIDNHIISPNVMARTVKLHPITVMLALLAAGSLFGIFGMLLVVPGIAAVKVIAIHFWSKRSVRDAIVAAMPDGATPSVVSEAVTVAEADGDDGQVVVKEERTVIAKRKRSSSARAPAKRRTTRGSPGATKRTRSRGR
jgi:predicted PurR-regulated permease PerM